MNHNNHRACKGHAVEPVGRANPAPVSKLPQSLNVQIINAPTIRDMWITENTARCIMGMEHHYTPIWIMDMDTPQLERYLPHTHERRNVGTNTTQALRIGNGKRRPAPYTHNIHTHTHTYIHTYNIISFIYNMYLNSNAMLFNIFFFPPYTQARLLPLQ